MRTSTPSTVLLVNDNADEREMYAATLALAGYRTLEAETVLSAFQFATGVQPDVVITDVVLRGEENGFGLTRLLKADYRTRHLPVIILTGRVFDSDREAATRVECDLFLTKPCLPDTLVEHVNRLLEAARQFGRPSVFHTRRAAKGTLDRAVIRTFRAAR